MEPPATPVVAGTPRWVKILLVVSLAINLLVLGTIGGSIWAFRHGQAVTARGGGPHLLTFTRTLDRDRRFEVWKVTRNELRALRPLRKEVRRARAEARMALTAAPFDKDRFAAAQARVLETEVKARREAQKLFIAIAEVLTPEERAAFAKWQTLRRSERMRHLRDGAQKP